MESKEMICRSNRSRIKAGGLLLLAAAVALSGCSASGSGNTASNDKASPGAGSREITKVSIATPLTTLPFAPLYVAISGGYFEDEGIDVDLIEGGGTTQVSAALRGGDADLAISASSDFINSAAKGEDIVAAGAINSGLTMQTVVSNEFMDEHNLSNDSSLEEKLSALMGADMGAVSLGGAHEIFLRYNMTLVGKDPKEVNVVRTGAGAAMLAALESGHIDGFMSGPPLGAQAELNGTGTILFDPATVEAYRNLPWQVLYMERSYGESNPEVMRSINRALTRGMETVANEPEEAAKLIGGYFKGMPEDLILGSLKELVPLFEGDTAMTEEGWANAISPVENAGLVSNVSPKEGELWTNEFVGKD
jgi:NitT/TauT family transport system substrate-binding protein